jgi:calcineurin-like phosphoesterase family protein
MKHFTADLHLGHGNIIKYAKRPFKNSLEMDEAIIENWNSKVATGDEVYVIGDVGLTDADYIVRCLERMHGNKYLIEGNHDERSLKSQRFREQFVWIERMREIEFNDPSAKKGRRPIVLCHYAMRVWNRSHHGAYHLYGHSHGKLPDDRNSLSMDVGIDAHNYFPISLEEIQEYMFKKNWKPLEKDSYRDH